MRTIFFAILLTLFLGGSISVEAKKPKEIKVQIHQQKRVPGTKLTVKFLELAEDSRCPTGVNCIWEGNAKIKIQISRNGKAAKTLELNSNLPNKDVIFEGHEFKLTALTPHPGANIRINPNGYIATIEIVKK
ncbi:MAG: hypothetical protein H7070_12775 [Saprospiraceae bacterium]|nr:hypothetical protein [Pyrinomonadaceae bacterium]